MEKPQIRPGQGNDLGWLLMRTMLNNVGGFDAIVNSPPVVRFQAIAYCDAGGTDLQPSQFHFPVHPVLDKLVLWRKFS